MKKLFPLLVLMLLSLLLSACGAQANESEESRAESGSAEQSAASDSGETEPADESGYRIVLRDVEIAVDAEAAPLIAALGDDYSYSEDASCFFENSTERYYMYTDFSIVTYTGTDGAEYVYYVKLLDDLVQTPEGLYIGASEAEVDAAYGSAYAQNGAYRYYLRGNTNQQIRLTDGSVTAIIYMLNV